MLRSDDDTAEVVRVGDDVRKCRHAWKNGEGLEGGEGVVGLGDFDGVLG